MKIKLLDDNRIIEIKHWTYTVIDNKKVIVDQEGKVIGIVLD